MNGKANSSFKSKEETNSGFEYLEALRIFVLAEIALISLLVIAGCQHAPRVPSSPAQHDDWHEFHGTWTATGSRQTIALGDGRRASIADFTGSLLLEGTSRPAVGFRAEALVLSDTATGIIGRAVWTDERGDEVYSELKGEGTATSNKVEGTFLGGTGRYSGATGTYEFSWRFVIGANDGIVQGQSMGLKGRFRLGSRQTIPKVNGSGR